MMSLPVTKQVLLFSHILIRIQCLNKNIVNNQYKVCYMAFDAGSDECELTGQEDPVVLYTVIENSPLQHAFKEGITKKTHIEKSDSLNEVSYTHFVYLHVCV